LNTKTILITGGGRGLGRATAGRLASLGHRVLLTARNLVDGQRAVAQIEAQHVGAKAEARELDLSSLASVRTFGEQLSSEGFALDVLFNCAGVMQQNPIRQTTRDGFEQTLAVNVLAPFLLTQTLMPALWRSGEARVVNVSSRLHLPGSRGKPVKFDFADPQMFHGYNPDRAYKNSKLALLWFTYELQRRLGAGSPVTANAVCPGFVPMTAANSTTGFQRWLLRHVLAHMPFSRTIDEAVDSFVFMAVEPGLAGAGGKFFGEKAVIESSPESHDETKANQFWQLAAEATGSGAWPW
jgi:NAD(P)-dependent dehydrogenase (short-subunit alcohol dehydrogenase family)